MKDVEKLKIYIGKLLVKYGFEKSGQKWVLNTENCALVFAFEKSNNSDSYYLTVGFWFVELEALPKTFSHAGNFHIKAQLSDLVSEAELLTLQFEFEEMTGYKALIEDRLQIIEATSEVVFLKLLNEWSTIELIKNHYFAGHLESSKIRYDVRYYFGDDKWRKEVRAEGDKIVIVVPE